MENCDKNNEEQKKNKHIISEGIKVWKKERKKNGCCQESIKHDVIVEEEWTKIKKQTFFTI